MLDFAVVLFGVSTENNKKLPSLQYCNQHLMELLQIFGEDQPGAFRLYSAYPNNLTLHDYQQWKNGCFRQHGKLSKVCGEAD